ncbi:hypothetical protein Pla163_20260 [Planctomycetes bacterium Pla163]|uniref:Uncharacterized protein n=1 Tax=Rohdeia mirabilis TaxID=2528008 RepID=A0A518D0B2_9BACT|nr:hypothetical protein Pla163_20260 [Planctomycetes bacterium Pla163]
MEDPLRKLALADGRYSPDAFRFLLEGLEEAIAHTGRAEKEGPERHVTGREVLVGLVARGRRTFGPLGGRVWRSWGVHAAIDWGRIVFLMVDNGMLNRRESDSIEDFRADLDFDAEFVEAYELELPETL